MSDLAPPLLLRAPQMGKPADLPAHLYGTRAALFYLLRETEAPAAFDIPRPVAPPAPPLAAPLALVPARPSAEIVPLPVEPVRAARPAVRDMLMSDNFDFRDPG